MTSLGNILENIKLTRGQQAFVYEIILRIEEIVKAAKKIGVRKITIHLGSLIDEPNLTKEIEKRFNIENPKSNTLITGQNIQISW